MFNRVKNWFTKSKQMDQDDELTQHLLINQERFLKILINMTPSKQHNDDRDNCRHNKEYNITRFISEQDAKVLLNNSPDEGFITVKDKHSDFRTTSEIKIVSRSDIDKAFSKMFINMKFCDNGIVMKHSITKVSLCYSTILKKTVFLCDHQKNGQDLFNIWLHILKPDKYNYCPLCK